ncbi:2-(3-amino-3-carboxypropyl)histidine synthase subunit 1, partial [Haematococcus lacustris]
MGVIGTVCRLAQPNVALLLSTLYSLFYISLEPVAGLSFAACMAFPGFFLAGAWVHAVPKAWAWAIPIHVFSWVMQIWPGHIILEKARPALVDNLVQAFALAPFFVWFELLFFLGYRPDLYQQLEVRVQAAVEERNKHKKPLILDGYIYIPVSLSSCGAHALLHSSERLLSRMTSDCGEQAEPSRFHGRGNSIDCHQNEAPATSTSTDIAPAQPPAEKAIKRFVRQQLSHSGEVPTLDMFSARSAHATAGSIVCYNRPAVLPANYNFEIHKTVWRLRQARAHAAALQFPEGLLMYAATIADILERFAGVDHCLIMGDVTYGACCVDDLSAVAMGADFLVHYGHSCLVPVDVTSLPCLYVFVDIAIDVDHLVGCVGLTFTPGTQLVLAGTIQFSTALQLARSALLPAFPALAIPKVAPLSPGEVLGCTAPVVTSAADAIVFVADGRFHLEAIMIANPALPAYRYDPYARQLTREHYDQAGMRAARRKAVERAGTARHWGLVLGTLGRQGNPHLLDHLRDELQSSGARTTTFLISELSPARLALVPDIDALLALGCL